MTVEALRAVCPRCRRLVRPGTCELDGNLALELADPAQRERMVELTWGTPEHRAALRRNASNPLGAQRTVAASVLFALTAIPVYAFTSEGLFALIAGGINGLLGAALAKPRPQILIPGPAGELPSWPRVSSGRMVHGDELLSPGSGTPCIGWAIELRYDGAWGVRSTFRAAATRGIDIVLDGGDLVRIPAGAFWIDGRFRQLDGEHASIDELLRTVDPLAGASEWELFPFNIITEELLYEGDRVDVLGVVEPRVIAGDLRLYRDAPETELLHVGLPVVRRA